jgi:HPt (histidine-containing phosphotransfer) domain-containing protein
MIGGDDPRLKALFARYREELDNQIDELQKLFQEGDFVGAEAIAHMIHGSAGSFGLPEISRSAGALERCLQNRNSAAAEFVLDKLIRRVRNC